MSSLSPSQLAYVLQFQHKDCARAIPRDVGLSK
jgi:hypothetical protein